MYVGEEAYDVQVVEECSQSVESCHCRRTSVTWSSEEVDSDDSSIGTPVSSSRRAPSHPHVEVATMQSPDTTERRRFCPTAGGVDDVASLEPLNMADQWRTSFDSTVGKDAEALNMQTPNTDERRRPCSDLANGASGLPTSPTTVNGPLGTSLDPRVKTHVATTGPTATGADLGNDKEECQGQGSEAASAVQDWCKEGGAQAIRKEVRH